MNLARDRDVINTAKTEGKLQGLVEGEAKGKLQGLAEGEAKAKIEFAKILKSKQVALEIIQETTGLTQQEIENL